MYRRLSIDDLPADGTSAAVDADGETALCPLAVWDKIYLVLVVRTPLEQLDEVLRRLERRG
jgi:hypothetical protein